MLFKNKKSIKGYFWNIKDYDEKLALTIFQKKHVSGGAMHSFPSR